MVKTHFQIHANPGNWVYQYWDKVLCSRFARPAFLCQPAFGKKAKLCSFFLIFCDFCIKILAKTSEKGHFALLSGAIAPKSWSKYTTSP